MTTTSLPSLSEAAGPILEVEDLRVRIGTSRGVVHAVQDVGFTVARGEFLAILGESGCGKSATARAIAGLGYGPRGEISGSIRLDGEDLAAMPDSRRRRYRGSGIAMVFQDALASLNPVQRVGNQIAESLRVGGMSRGQARARVLELLADVGIPDPARRSRAYPHEFSGGMRQRAMIALALARDPAVLVADEPTTALDVTVQAQILELLDKHRRERDMALILISHDLGVVARNADTIVVMYAGRVVEYGAAADVLGSPRHPYTEGLFRSAASRRRTEGRMRPIPGSPPDLTVTVSGCPFAPRCERVVDECRVVRPRLRPAGAGRLAACHLVEEVAS